MSNRMTQFSMSVAIMLTFGLLVDQTVGADRNVDSRTSTQRTAAVAKSAPQQKSTATESAAQQPSTSAPATNTAIARPTGVQADGITPATPTKAAGVPNTGETIGWMILSGGGGRATSLSNSLETVIGQTASVTVSNGSLKINLGFLQEFGPTSCCTGTTGNVNMAGIVDLGDLSALVNYLTGGGYVLICTSEANVNNAGIVDLGDLSALVNYLTGGGYALPNCL